jgi:predicted RNase H-like nuclease (RuvC/YqgF family)
MSEENNIPAEGEAVKEQPKQVDPAELQGENESSSEEIQALKSQLSEVTGRLQQQSAQIGKLNNALKREAKEEDGEPEPKPEGLVSKHSELEKKLDSYAERFAKQERAAKINGIELSLIEAGAEPALAKNQAEFYAFKLGDRLQATEDHNGRLSIEVADVDGTTAPVGNWAKAYLESDDGLYMKATRKGPSVKNVGDSAGGPKKKVALNSNDYSRQFAEANNKGSDAVESFRAAYTMQ